MTLINEIKSEIAKISRPIDAAGLEFVGRYLGTDKIFLNVKAADRDKLLAKYLKQIKLLPIADQIDLIDELCSSDTFEHINLGGKLLLRLPKARKEISLEQIRSWIAATKGWAECDGICQTAFTTAEVLERWDEWGRSIRQFSVDPNIQVRRMSLVLQVRPAGKSTDPQIFDLAIETIEKLKTEKAVLITKAISWLLRALANENKAKTMAYIEKNRTSLPAIAYRETMKKIQTGKKTS